MTTTFTTITLAGITLDAAYDDKTKEYLVSFNQAVEQAGGGVNLPSRLMKGKAPEFAQALGSDVHREIKRKKQGRNYRLFMPSRFFTHFIGVMAQRGHNEALALLVALANEAIERRIDVALDQQRPEQSYEESTREFFEQLSRKQFIPEFTSWFEDSPYAVNYGKEVNIFKAMIGVPQKPKQGYSREHMETWSLGLASYNTLRMEGYSHQRALKRIKANRLARSM